MPSFFEVWNSIQEQNNDDEEQQALKVIRKGLSFSKPGCKDFWESFKELCGDSKGMSSLLGVDTTTINQWSHKIDQYLTKIRIADSQAGDQDRATLISTGLTAGTKDVRGTIEEPRPL